METMQLLLDGARGIYIPQNFAECFDVSAWNVSDELRDILLAGPDHEHYWDAWEQVLDNAHTSQYGEKWTLYQDGDLFAVADSHSWEDPE
jgi:hypothetical protein